MRTKNANEGAIQRPFSNSTRNQPISGSYPLSMMQYEDEESYNPDYEELHREDFDKEKTYSEFRKEKESLQLSKEEFENAKPGDVFYTVKGDNVYKVIVDDVRMMKHRTFSGNRKSAPEITIISTSGKEYRVGSLLRSKPKTERNVSDRGLMDPRNFKGNDYYSSYEKYKAKHESKNEPKPPHGLTNKINNMRAKEVMYEEKGWARPPMGGYQPDSYYERIEKEQNAKFRAEQKARNEIYKKMKKAYVLSIGTVSPANGKTMYDWNIYDTWPDGWAFLLQSQTGGHCLVFSSNEDDFEIGEEVILYGNDSGRRLTHTNKIKDKAPVEKEALVDMLYKYGYDYKPKRAFQRASGNRRLGGPAKLGTSYSVKGITMMR